MTEATAAPAQAPAAAASAGALMKRAREARGLHVAVLAASLKVPPRRLEALEQDRWDELPDPAFTRALAQSVCRALKTDPAPVLALLPRADASQLEHVSGRINAPFRERPGSGEPGIAGLLTQPAVWIVGLLLVAAGAVLLWPSGLGPEKAATEPAGAASTETPQLADAGVPEPASVGGDAAAAGQADAGAAAAPAETTDATGATGAAGAAAPTAAVDAPGAGTRADGSAAPAAQAPPAVEAAVSGAAAPPLLQIRVAADSWVEVRDAAGQVLVSRTVSAGETLSLEPALPARLTAGNVADTEVWMRGERVDLTAQQRGNIARLELR